MKNTVILCLGLSLSGVVCAQEALPEAPKPSTSRNLNLGSKLLREVKHPYTLQGETSFYKSLYATDGILRIGDAVTTYKILSDPCKCFKEADPLAPKSSSPVLGVLFQASALMAITQAHNLLIVHGHKKLAHILLWADVASEAIAVGHNASLTPNSSRVAALPKGSPITYKPLN